MNLHNLLNGEISQEDLLKKYNATIIYEFLPTCINGCLFNYDNVNFILINNSNSHSKQQMTILNELARIELNKLNSIKSDSAYLKFEDSQDETDLYIKTILNKIK